MGITQTMLLHKLGEVKENPVVLDRGVAKQVSDGCNVLLCSVYTLFHQLKKHHWVVEGPDFRDLHLLLDELAAHCLTMGDQLAERITVLAAYPISTPRKQQEMALFPIEEEGVFDLRTMLLHDMRAYQNIILRYRDMIRLSMQCGDFGTEQLLKEQLQMLEFDVHHLEHVLGEDTLTRM
ncbi:DNA starvation/stationary phase protection protein DpsA [Brevibacillus dissolubilis]|uniref:DNA starvation/stationary phase protection protein DpsA n=1 Tax=Brevibacillus dissolubilis TaxID=1844116 RepID=UPI0011173A5A|nr:DNA starvation/stationary phase protection protein DpsA [Brevibacillus dissolubilis]